MKTRLITGVVLLAVFVPLFVIGGLAFDITLLVLSMAGTWELSRMYRQNTSKPQFITWIEVAISGGLFYLIKDFYQNNVDASAFLYALIGVLVIASLLLIFIEEFSSKEFGNFFISVLYPVLGFGALSGLRSFENGLLVIGFLFMITVMTDVFAYVVGVNFGKHRLAVKISPKKSIEGSIGGTVFAIIFTVIYVNVVSLEFIDTLELGLLVTILVVFVVSIMGQIGDLVASKLKRDCGVKDYSNIFPGHGGVMDRFDSAIFAAMVLMLLIKVIAL